MIWAILATSKFMTMDMSPEAALFITEKRISLPLKPKQPKSILESIVTRFDLSKYSAD